MGFSGITKLIQSLTAKTTLSDADSFIFGGSDMFRITVANLKNALGITKLNTDLSSKTSGFSEIQFGTFDYTSNGTGFETVRVNFNKPFADTPVVNIFVRAAGGYIKSIAGAQNVTKDGFTAQIAHNTAKSQVWYGYIAVR